MNLVQFIDKIAEFIAREPNAEVSRLFENTFRSSRVEGFDAEPTNEGIEFIVLAEIYRFRLRRKEAEGRASEWVGLRQAVDQLGLATGRAQLASIAVGSQEFLFFLSHGNVVCGFAYPKKAIEK